MSDGSRTKRRGDRNFHISNSHDSQVKAEATTYGAEEIVPDVVEEGRNGEPSVLPSVGLQDTSNFRLFRQGHQYL